jgi:hypothetical protein
VRGRIVGGAALVALACVSASLHVLTAEPPDLSGRWVLVEVMPAAIELPIVGHVELTTIVALLVDIEQDGARLTLQRTYCFQDVRTAPPLVTTVIPDRFIASLAPSSAKARLEETPGGWRFVQSPCVEVHGARLLDPGREALPASALDLRVVDQDGDGYPGLTIHVAIAGLLGGNAYVVNRLSTSLEGWLLEDGSIAGAVQWTSEQTMIGASDPLLLMSYEYLLDPDPAKHFFVLRRIDGPDPCRAIRDNLADLLGLPPG